MLVVLWPFLISFIDQLCIDLEKVLSYESMSYVHLHTYVGSCFVVCLCYMIKVGICTYVTSQ